MLHCHTQIDFAELQGFTGLHCTVFPLSVRSCSGSARVHVYMPTWRSTLSLEEQQEQLLQRRSGSVDDGLSNAPYQ